MTVEQFDVLHECLPLAGRVGSEFAAELLRLVPDTLKQTYPKQPEPLIKRAALLDCALSLAGHFSHHDLAGRLAKAFGELVTSTTGAGRLELVNRVTEPCVRCLRRLGLRDELDTLLQRLLTAVIGRGTLIDWVTTFNDNPEQQLKALQVVQPIAGGWLALGRTEQADPILDVVRAELLSPSGGVPMPQEHTRLATAYIAAVGHGPAESGFRHLNELFRQIAPNKILNSFVTAPFFSRLHLEVAEEVVLAILEMRASGPPIPR